MPQNLSRRYFLACSVAAGSSSFFNRVGIFGSGPGKIGDRTDHSQDRPSDPEGAAVPRCQTRKRWCFWAKRLSPQRSGLCTSRYGDDGQRQHPGRGPYGEHLRRCVSYLLANTHDNGFVCDAPASSHGPMYGHGFATLFLAQCYGMSQNEELRKKLTAAIRLIVTTQNSEGGWRYQPQPTDADISVTVCEVMALRAARNAGLHVPNETIDKSIAYVKKVRMQMAVFAT